jgi:anti-sigma B factor antagonist
VDCRTVDEYDAVQVEHEWRFAVRQLAQALDEPVGVREIELPANRDESEASLIGLRLLQLVRRHRSSEYAPTAHAVWTVIHTGITKQVARLFGRSRSFLTRVYQPDARGMFVAPMGERAFMPEVGGDFRVDVEKLSDGAIVVVVHGEADLHSAPELRDRLAVVIDDGASRVLVDLSDTSFIDSMALGVLLGSTKRLRASSGQLELIVSKPDIRRIFEITMLDRILVIHPSREIALELGNQDAETV